MTNYEVFLLVVMAFLVGASVGGLFVRWWDDR